MKGWNSLNWNIQHLSSEDGCQFRYVDCSYGCGEKLLLHKDLQLHEEKSMAVHLKMTLAKVVRRRTLSWKRKWKGFWSTYIFELNTTLCC